VFASYHERLGIGTAALAIVPVIGASWYFGITGGVLTVLLSILANGIILLGENRSSAQLFQNPGDVIGALALLFAGVAIGRLGTILRERRDAILKLENYERDRQAHTDFLELLNEITAMTLEAESLDSTLKILGERIGTLFQADDCFFSLWDETKQVPLFIQICSLNPAIGH
jgi:hypothetical protein